MFTRRNVCTTIFAVFHANITRLEGGEIKKHINELIISESFQKALQTRNIFFLCDNYEKKLRKKNWLIIETVHTYKRLFFVVKKLQCTMNNEWKFVPYLHFLKYIKNAKFKLSWLFFKENIDLHAYTNTHNKCVHVDFTHALPTHYIK